MRKKLIYTLSGLALLITLTLVLYLFSNKQTTSNQENAELATNAIEQDVFKCPELQMGKTTSTLDGKLIDLRYTLRDKYSDEENVGQYLQSIGVRCKSEQLVKDQNPIVVFRNLGCWNRPPENSDELIYQENKHILELRKGNNLIEITCIKKPAI